MKLIRLILESERRVGRDPIQFLALNNIANGQFVSMGYLVEQLISKDRRHVTQETDADFEKLLRDSKNSTFNKDMRALRNSQSYRDALSGVKKTAKFDALENVHILKFGRYNFRWQDTKSQRDLYENEEVQQEWAIRAKHGFINKNNMAPSDYEEAVNTPSWRDKYGGNGVMPVYRSANKHDGVSHVVSPDNRDFFLDDNGKLSFKAILGYDSSHSCEYFYVKETTGRILPLDREAYYFLANAFSHKKVKEAKEKIDEEEEDFLDDMQQLTLKYTRCSFLWDRMMYIAGYQGSTEEPFVWINDDAIRQTYPYLNEDDLLKLIYENIEQAKADIEKIIN